VARHGCCPALFRKSLFRTGLFRSETVVSSRLNLSVDVVVVSKLGVNGFGKAISLVQPVVQISELATGRAKGPRRKISGDVLEHFLATGANDAHTPYFSTSAENLNPFGPEARPKTAQTWARAALAAATV
jgi:hypothetical protein